MSDGVSILLSYYNGGEYFESQFKSILQQLGNRDEVLIRDDGSDGSNRVEQVISKLPNIQQYFLSGQVRILNGVNVGVNKSFEILLNEAKHDVSVFCDQDDVWKPGRLNSCREHRNSDLHCVNFEIEGISQVKADYRVSQSGVFRRNKFPGCCMSGQTDYLRGVMRQIPPKLIYDHALLYISLIRGQKITLDYTPRVIYRRHPNTVTKYQSLLPNGLLSALRLRCDLLRLRS